MRSRSWDRSFVGPLLTLAAFAVVIGALDVYVVGRLIHGVRSYRFAAASGEVSESHVEASTSRGRPFFYPVVRYRYEAEGRSREGTFGKQDLGTFRTEAAAVRAADQYPPGHRFAVYYDPAAPDGGVTVRGIRGEDLFFLLFAVPFNLVLLAIGAITVPGVAVARRRARVAGPGVAVREVGGRLHVRLPAARNVEPAVAAAAGTGLASAAVTVLGGSIAGGNDVPHWLPVSGLWWTLLAGVYAYGRSNPVRARGRRELVIDPVARTLTLPPAGRGGDPLVIAFTQVVNVRGAGFAGKQPAWARGLFHPTITWRAKRKGTQSTILGAAADRESADRFARWLEKQVGLRA